MVKVNWINNGTSLYRKQEGVLTVSDVIPKAVYEVGADDNGWYLSRTAEEFTFPYKLYGLENEFMEHVIKTYENTKGNLGVLCNGIRGTGKTVCCKIIANRLNLPVVIVKSFGPSNPSLMSYLSSLNFDCIFFFDEFEKQFNDKDCSILQFMDGIYSSEFRRVFLLTTNMLNVNENLLTRPSRIRYVKQFGNLAKEIVEEYLDDNLKDNSNREALLEYIDTLTISTIDILKAVVEEVNIHGIQRFLEMKKIFNVSYGEYHYRTTVAYIDTDYADDDDKIKNYSIAEFVKEYEYYDKRFKIDGEYRDEMAAAKDKAEKIEIEKKYAPMRRLTGRFTTQAITSEKAWTKFVPGDKFADGTIVGISLDKYVIVTKRGSYLYFFYIENPTEKPSLYNPEKYDTRAYAYLM